MKKTILTTSVLASLFFFNCSKDDSSDENNNVEVTESAIEETNIEVGTLEDGISIEGSTIETGSISSNEQTTFSVSKTEQSGFQDVGFEIELNVPENYAGAYLQLLSEDGTPSENYYNIPVVDYNFKNISNSNASSKFFSTKSANLSAKTLEDEVETIEVDFDSSVPAGSFCYFLCIYDTDGNISAPQTLCVEVEDWGGNDGLAGNWTFTKADFTEYGESYTQIRGEEFCEKEDYTKKCYDDNGTLVKEENITSCESIISFILNLNNDGSQSYTYNDMDSDSEFSEDCVLMDIIYTSEFKATGNWAYDEEEEKLTLVNYTSDEVETKNGEPYDDEYVDENEDEIGVGFDLYVTKLTSNELVIEYRDIDREYNNDTDSYDEFEYKAVYHFTK